MEEAEEPDEEAAFADRLAQVVEDAYTNSVWAVPDVDAEPSVQTWRWNVRELPNGNRHLCAWMGDYGRVSSAITKWEPREKVLVTSSGRRYCIDSPIGTHADAEHVLGHVVPSAGISAQRIRRREPRVCNRSSRQM